jgi:hypothetical protein
MSHYFTPSTPKTCIVLRPIPHGERDLGDVVAMRSVVHVRRGRAAFQQSVPEHPLFTQSVQQRLLPRSGIFRRPLQARMVL